ncbi:MAG: glycosyltransferase family 4 protein [Polyangiaceae bacterium]|nr:glycosyltransferase family 4 protein [Polyangiaceae bacterium]
MAPWFLERRVKKEGSDILLLLAANRRIVQPRCLPTVAVVHDLAQLHLPRKYDWLRMQYFHRVIMGLLPKQTRLVAISQATKDDMTQLVGLEEKNIRVVYNGVDSRFSRSKALGNRRDVCLSADTARSSWRGSDASLEEDDQGPGDPQGYCRGLSEHPYIYYPARFEAPAKNHARLIQAFRPLARESGTQLVLSGADWGAESELRALVHELSLEDHVLFPGYVSSEGLRSLMGGAAGVVLPGLYEGFGLPAVEALALGLPVAVAQAGALPEVVGPYGFFFDPYSVDSITAALERMLMEGWRTPEQRSLAMHWARGFSWETTAAGLLEECRAAVEGS